MIESDMIPDEVVEAAAIVLHANAEIFSDILWDDLGADDKEAYCLEARATIAAALNAWPGNIHYRGGWEPVINNHQRKPQLILPLPQENPDDQG